MRKRRFAMSCQPCVPIGSPGSVATTVVHGCRLYVALVARDLLSERVVKLMAIDVSRGWHAFESFFADEIRRLILRMLPGSAHRQDREDAYQSVCEALLKNDLQRLRAYSGRGSPSGFILQVIENLLIDYVRTIHAASPSSGCDPAPIGPRSIGFPAYSLGAARLRPSEFGQSPDAT